MHDQKTKCGTQPFSNLLRFAIASFFAFLVLFIPVSTLSGQSAANQAVAQVSSGPIVAGQRFDLVIRLPDLGFSAPQAVFPNLPSRLSFISGPEIYYDVGLDEQGRRSRFVYMRFVFRSNTPGYIEFPPVPVTMGLQSFQTDPVLIGIAPPDDPRTVPPELFWDIRDSQVFEGQAVFVNLSLRFVTAIAFPDKVEVSQTQGGIFEEAPGLGRIETENIAGTQFQRVPVATYIFTPSIRGSLNLPGAKVTLGKTVLNTAPRQLNVVALPAELGATGAIGDVKFTPILGAQRIGQDEQVTLTMRVEGEGNLNFLRIPEPQAPDLLLLGKSENNRYVPSELGYRGFREVVYRFAAVKAGTANISVPGFASMRPDGGVDQQIPRTLALIVDKATANGGTKQSRFPTLKIEEIAAMHPWYLHRSLLAVALFLPGLIFLLAGIGLSLRRKSRNKAGAIAIFLIVFLVPQTIPAAGETRDWRDQVRKGNEAYEAGDFQTAFEAFEEALSIDPNSPGIMYNLALAAFEKGSAASGVFYAQHALRILPNDTVLREGLETWESRLGLDRQHSVVNLPPSDIVLVAVAVSWTLAGFVFFVARGRLRSLSVILLVLLFFALAGSLGVFIYDINQMRVPLGVVAEQGGLLRRIPDAAADEWLNLPSGTSVVVTVRSGSFYLVETSYGIKGWLDRSAIFYDQSSSGF